MKTMIMDRWGLLFNYLRPQAARFVLLAILLLSNIGLQLINPLIVRYFIDAAVANAALQALIGAAMLFIGISIVIQILSVAETYVAENLGWIATNNLRSDLVRHCLKLDLMFHKDHTPGEFIERIDGDVTKMANFFSRFVITVLGNSLLLVGMLIILFQVDWRVGLSLATFTIIGLISLNRLQGLALPHWTSLRQSNAELFGFLEERLAATIDIRSNGATMYMMRRLYQLMHSLLISARKATLMFCTSWTTTVVLFALGSAIAFALGAYLFTTNVMTIGTVYLIFRYTELLRAPMEGITYQVQDLQQATASIKRIQELLRSQSMIQDGPSKQLPSGPLSVEFQDVSFGYVPNELVLRDISFHLQPGKVLGLLGRTGSGKTTLARLLFRLYDPNIGTIRIGGGDLRAVNLAYLRQRIGIVTQDVQLFHATVRDNLTFFNSGIPDAAIVQVLKNLGMFDWYHSLPDSLDTELGSSGSGLSAGQAQLLAFARVFLRDPSVIILDEASSRLDPVTECLLEQAITELLQNRTGIIIAHRLPTLQHVDQIMILEAGRICEYGDREQLARDPSSYFYQLLQTGLEETLI